MERLDSADVDAIWQVRRACSCSSPEIRRYVNDIVVA